MKKFIPLILALVCVLSLVGCNQKTQYYFSAKVIEVDEAFLLLDVFDAGNSNLSKGTKIEVSTNTVSADGCPEFVVGEYARVLMARNTSDNPSGRFEALSIYKTDETGKVTAD